MSDGTENAGYSSEDILDEKVNSKTYGDENLNKPPEIKITLDVDNHNPALEKDEDIKVHSMNTGNCFLNSPNSIHRNVNSFTNNKRESDDDEKEEDEEQDTEEIEIGGDDKKNKKGGKKESKCVSIKELFKHSDSIDVLLIIFGTICAILHGLTLPGQLVIFGQLITKFLDFAKDSSCRNGTENIESGINIQEEMLIFSQVYAYMAIGSWLVAYVQCGFWSITAIRQIHRIRLKFMKSILRQDVGWYDVNETGGLSTRMFDDLTQIQTGIGDKCGAVIQALSTLVGGVIIAFVFGWKLALVMLALSPVIMAAGALTGKVMGALSNKEQTAYSEAGSVAEEAISSIRTVVAFGGEKDEMQRYNAKLKVAEKVGIRKAFTSGLSMGTFSIVMASSQAIAFWYGSRLVADGEIEGGNLLTVFFAILIGSAQLGQAGPNFESLTSARGAAYYIYEVIDRVSPIDSLSEEGTKPEMNHVEDITFSDVTFHYPSRDTVQVLDNFDLTIKKGMTVALVGESGCGKSTVIKMLQRFYDPTSGIIKIGDHDIKEMNVRWLREHIGIVSQEPVLFDMSIADNIKMGKTDATQQEIEYAAINANAHDFISDLPKGYETNVGEGGAQLSGGQKQRIAIARALIKDPKLLLLDEATSALDTESESIVQTALDNASLGRTTIIIAHRLSTVKNADMIVAVAGGKVAETGTHEDLMQKKGIYYQLVMLQSLAEKEATELSELGSVISEQEMEELMEVRMMRSLSKLSEKEDENVSSLARALSTRRSHINKDKLKKTKRKTKKKKKEVYEEEEVDPAPISRILQYNKPEWPHIFFGTFFSAVYGCFPVVFAIIISEILRTLALPNKDDVKSESRKWSLVFLGMGGINFTSYFMSSVLFGKAGESLTRRLREKAFETILKQDIAYFDDPYHGTGQLTSRLASDASKVKGATSSRINVLVQVSFTGIAALIVAFYYSWKLTLLVVAFIPFLVFGGIARASKFKNFAAKEGKRYLEAGKVCNQAVMNIRTVASLGKEKYFIDKFERLIVPPYKQSKVQAHFYGITFGSARGLSFFASSGIFALGGYLVQNCELEFFNVFKIVISATFGSMIAGQALSFTPDFLSAKLAAGRLFKLFDTESAIDVNDTGGVIKKSLAGDISFSNVCFNYPTRPDVPVLQGLNLNIKSGQKIALVGASGCGKSTSVGLLERFYNPKAGDITIDNEDIASYNLKWLRSQISIVSQEPILFAKTIRGNITYGMMSENDKPISQNVIEECARAANIHDFIMSLPKGYDTMVGDKGTLISGGQKQRIAIARALIRNPRILLLDEATSALDSESEKLVQEALDRAMEQRTSIIIAHRLSTVQNADVIAVIQGGRVIEMGTHQELLQKRGAYYMLNAAQM